MYGYLHRGRVITHDPATGSFELTSIGLARTSRWGPVPSAVPGIEVGDRVILGATGTSRDDLVIIAKVGADFPDIGDIPGLQAALNAKADDSEITTINNEITTINGTLDDINGDLATIGGVLADHETRLDTAEPTITSHGTRLTTAEGTLATSVARVTAVEISSSLMDRDLYNDAVASMRRMDVVNGIALTNSTLYLTRLYARRSLGITAIRMATAVAGTVGTCAIGLYAGSGTASNNFALVRSGSITLTTLGRVTHNLSSGYVVPDGTNLLVALLPVSYTVAPQIGGRTGIVHSSLLNAAVTFHSSLTKAAVGSLPATIDLTDGSWTTAITHLMWAALA